MTTSNIRNSHTKKPENVVVSLVETRRFSWQRKTTKEERQRTWTRVHVFLGEMEEGERVEVSKHFNEREGWFWWNSVPYKTWKKKCPPNFLTRPRMIPWLACVPGRWRHLCHSRIVSEWFPFHKGVLSFSALICWFYSFLDEKLRKENTCSFGNFTQWTASFATSCCKTTLLSLT